MNEQEELLKNWEEVRIAYHVARLGTLSAAAEHLGIHHATVIRHIDALEGQLGCKLFQRNPRGYHPTEAGIELMQTAEKTKELLGQMAGNLKGRRGAVSGELVVTSLSGLSPLITPLLSEFLQLYPDIRMTFIGDDRTLQLEYGEAHVALRAGARPQEMSNIVQQVGRLPIALFAHRQYVEKYGPMKGDGGDLANHRFVHRVLATTRAPFDIWMKENVPESSIVYKATDMRSVEDAVHAGAGIGFLSVATGQGNPDLVQMTPCRPEWDSVLWLVTHMDLHRTSKVQALASFLKDQLAQKIGNT